MTLCKICGIEFKVITPGHLRKHSTNLLEYQRKYGYCETKTNTGKTHFRKNHVPLNKGQPRSDEIKMKISESLKGKPSWNKGRKLSEEHKIKLSRAHKNKKMPEEVRKNIAKSLRGKEFTEERKKKISQSLKGRKLSAEWLKKNSKTWFKKNNAPRNKGKNQSEETKKRISDALKGGKWVNENYRSKMREITKKKWGTEEFREKFIEGMKKATKITPNKLEIKMIEIMKNNDFPFMFVGNGKFWIRNKDNSYNPDFLHKDKTQRKIIEIFGDYWHNKEDHKIRDIERIKTYKEKGFNVLILWENQLKESAEDVTKQIKNFLTDGV
jgi:G:T-mismatch repair DNA endonuclease (very short patch repair protein)